MFALKKHFDWMAYMAGHMPRVCRDAQANDGKVPVEEKPPSVAEGGFPKKNSKTIDKTLYWCYNT